MRRTKVDSNATLAEFAITSRDLTPEIADFNVKTDLKESEIVDAILYAEIAKRLTQTEYLTYLAHLIVDEQNRLAKKGWGQQEISGFVREIGQKPLDKWSEELFEALTFLITDADERKRFSRFYLKNILLRKEPPKKSNCASNRMLSRMLGFADDSTQKLSAYQVFEKAAFTTAQTLRLLFLINRKLWTQPLTVQQLGFLQKELFALSDATHLELLSERDKDDWAYAMVLHLQRKKEQYPNVVALSGIAYETIIDQASSFKALYAFYLAKDFEHFESIFAYEKNQTDMGEDLVAAALKAEPFDLPAFSSLFKILVRLLKGGGVSKICQILMKDPRFCAVPELEDLFRSGVSVIESNASLRTLAIVCGKHYHFQHPILNWLLRRLLLTSPADYNGFLRTVVNNYYELAVANPEWLIRLFRAQALVWKYTASANLNYMVMAGHRELAETVYQSIQEILGDARRPYLLLTRDNIDFGDLTLREELT